MDVQKLIGHNVTHKSFGTGRILSVNDTQVIVNFDTKGIKKLQFPQTFAKYMRIDDEYLQSEIMALEAEREAEERRQKQIEAEKISHLKAMNEVQSHAPARTDLIGNQSQNRTTRVGTNELNTDPYYYGDILVAQKTSFATHADVFNACFGFDYKHYQKAYKDLGNGYAVWFPCIARRMGDQYISTDNYTGWVNILSESGDTITQVDKVFSEPGTDDNNKRIIFARFDNDKRYTFIGIYIFRERIDNKQIYVRIGTRFDTRSMKLVE